VNHLAYGLRIPRSDDHLWQIKIRNEEETMNAPIVMPEKPTPPRPNLDTPTVPKLNAPEFAAAFSWCAKRYRIHSIDFNPDRRDGMICLTPRQGGKLVNIMFFRHTEASEEMTITVTGGRVAKYDDPPIVTPKDVETALDTLKPKIEQMLSANKNSGQER
jgi:hypothetical protein